MKIGFLQLYWSISESASSLGYGKTAKALWRVIRDKGPKDAPEVKFAISRLDPKRTEFESLWE